MSERIELYKVMLDTITANEQRRQQVTTVSASLLIAGMAAIGGIQSLDPVFIVLPSLPLALMWLLSVQYFRVIAQAKWAIVCKLEEGFEVKPFSDEWGQVKSKSALMRFELTHLEMALPAAIVGCSVAYLLFRLVAVFSA